MVKKFVFVISLCMVLACCGCGDESDLRKVDADRAETYEETAYGDTAGTHEETEYKDSVETAENVKAFFESVTFDGRKDLIISVGNSRHASYYCAYICMDDGFRHERTFEHIPSYEVKNDERVICGSDTDGIGRYADMTYEYKDGEFVLTDYVEKEIKEE